MTDPTDVDLTPAESLLFWAVIALAVVAVTGFCAGLVYPFLKG